MKLNIIVTSTRPGRIGEPIARWFYEYALNNNHGFEIVLTDLAEIDLPVFDEPNHPRFREYINAHTKTWSKLVDDSDAFVFVLAEYNHVAPPSFFNAVTYLSHEWAYKPAGFVSYGGVSGGIRAMESTKPVLTSVKVMPIPEQVMLPMAMKDIQEGTFQANQLAVDSADVMLRELSIWAHALATLRK